MFNNTVINFVSQNTFDPRTKLPMVICMYTIVYSIQGYLFLCLFILESIREIQEVSKSSILYPSVVSQSSLDPRTRLPMVIWKQVLPEDQLEILVNGWVTSISWKRENKGGIRNSSLSGNLLDYHVEGSRYETKK